MKKILILLTLALTSLQVSAQTWTKFNGYGLERKIVSGDTTWRFVGSAGNGMLSFVPSGGSGDVPTSRLVSAGYGLLGGGSLAADRVIYADSTVVRSWSNSLSLAQLQTRFDAKQGTITLTTTGSSGAATLIGNTLNIPIYTGGGGGSVTSVTSANGDITVANTTTTPVLTLNSGVNPSQIAKRNSAGGIEFNGTGADLIESPSSSVMNYKSAFSHSFYTAGTAVLTINTTTTAIGSGSFSTSATSPVTHAILSTVLTAPTTTGTTKMVITDVNGLLSFANIPSGGGSGTVNSGTANRLAYYASTGDAVSELSSITANRVLLSDANGLPIASSITNTTLGYLDATSSIQTQINSKQATLVSATNIKTINGSSILGSGNLTISGGGGENLNITTVTTSTSALTTDRTILADATSGNVTVTLPTPASSYSSGAGQIVTVKKISSANNVTVDVSGGADVDVGVTTYNMVSLNHSVTFQSNGTQWFILSRYN